MARLRHAGTIQLDHAVVATGVAALAALSSLAVFDTEAHAADTHDTYQLVTAVVTPAASVSPPPVSVSPTPSGWFTPVARYHFSARFGVAGSWSSGHHTGLDFVTRDGSPIRAATNGVVVAAGSAGAYGNLLQIRVAPKTEIWMAHLSRFTVKPGDVVKAGQTVGRVGMTGNTSGPHCHFELRVNEKAKNPEAYFWPDGKPVTRMRR